MRKKDVVSLSVLKVSYTTLVVFFGESSLLRNETSYTVPCTIGYAPHLFSSDFVR
jgi:hypothetical protein